MRGFRSTWIMAGLVALLAGYTYWDFQNSGDGFDEAKGERSAFQLKREDIQEVSLKLQGVDVLIKKMGEVWQIEKPVQDLAETSAVEGFLYGLMGEKLKTFHSETEDGKVDWSAFGLDNPSARIELVTSKAHQSMEVSSKNAFDGSFYVRQNNQILLGDKGLAQFTARSPQSFRSRKLWRIEGAQIERVDLEGEKQKFALVKEKDSWSLDPKPGFAVASSKIENFVSELEQLTAVDVVKDEISDQDKLDYFLKKPSQKVSVQFKDKANAEGHWALTLGQDKGSEVFLYNDQRATLYKTAKTAADRLRVSPAYFRDGKVPFLFDLEQASVVSVRTANLQHTFKKTDSGWELVQGNGGDGNLELDQDKLVELIQSLRNLEATEFVTGSSPGVKGPPQIEVKDSSGKTLLVLTWGEEFKGKNSWSSSSTLRYTKTNLSKEIMGVAKDKLDRLIDARLVRQKPADKKAEEPEKK